MANDLVKRLQGARRAFGLETYENQAITEAIAALTSRESARDFSEAAQWRDAAFETAAGIIEKYFPRGEWKYITDDIRALKSTKSPSQPAAKECEHDWLLYNERADGSADWQCQKCLKIEWRVARVNIDNRRKGPSDRRQSMYGTCGKRSSPMRRLESGFGRRKDDRARWVAPLSTGPAGVGGGIECTLGKA